MTKRLYYNQASATGDPRTGHGYGKAQKIPSMGSGQGSERPMSSSETGIYRAGPSYSEEDDEDEDDIFDDKPETDKFVRMINKQSNYSSDQGFWPRADRGSLGQTSIGWGLGLGATGIGEAAAVRSTGLSLPRAKGQRLPKASKSIAPFSASVLYPRGFDGPPLGSGGAGQAFSTTGNYKRTGTQYGSSRAPISQPEEEEFPLMNYADIIDMDAGERSILRQRVRIMRLLNKIDEIDSDEV